MRSGVSGELHGPHYEEEVDFYARPQPPPKNPRFKRPLGRGGKETRSTAVFWV